MCGARLLGRNRSRSIVRVRTRSNHDDGPPILPTDNFQLTAQLTLPPSLPLHKPRLRPNLKNMRVIALLALLAAPAVAFVPFTIKVRPVSLGVRNIRGRRGLQHMRRIGLLRPRARQQWQEGSKSPRSNGKTNNGSTLRLPSTTAHDGRQARGARVQRTYVLCRSNDLRQPGSIRRRGSHKYTTTHPQGDVEVIFPGNKKAKAKPGRP